MIEIGGAAGVGKSRLVKELVERSPDLQVLHARVRGVRSIDAVFRVARPMRAALGLAGRRAAKKSRPARLREVAARVDPELSNT